MHQVVLELLKHKVPIWLCVYNAEPMLESWPFQLEYRHIAGQRNLSLHSRARLNVIITPVAFRSLGDARSFIMLVSQAIPSWLLQGSTCRHE